MRIDSIDIKKFRSIEKAHIDMRDLTAIVGENNAGKTAILRALNSVFNFEDEKNFFRDGSHRYAPNSNTYITVVFSDIPDGELKQKYACNDTLKVNFSY